MNKVMLMGRLVRDAEVRYTQSGKAVATFTVAIDRPVAKGEEKQADFIPCVAWGKTAETIGNYLHKGSRILITDGRIQVRSYDANDGSKRYVTEVIVDRFEFVDSKAHDNAGQFNQDTQYNSFSQIGEEIPF